MYHSVHGELFPPYWADFYWTRISANVLEWMLLESRIDAKGGGIYAGDLDGPLAHLVERCVCIAEVGSSSLPRSTTLRSVSSGVASHLVIFSVMLSEAKHLAGARDSSLRSEGRNGTQVPSVASGLIRLPNPLETASSLIEH